MPDTDKPQEKWRDSREEKQSKICPPSFLVKANFSAFKVEDTSTDYG